MNEQESLELIRRCIDGDASEADRNALQEQLRRDQKVRRLFASYANIDATLGSGSIALRAPVLRAAPPRATRLAWRPLMAAAAGVAFGMFCTSVVFAYVGPKLGEVVALLDEGFESAPAPQATGVPTEAGRWSGDFAEIAGAQQGVTPHSGTKMWRFLRADNALGADAQRSYVGEAIRIVDLQPLRGAGVKPGSQIEISAWFAAGKTIPVARYHWNIKMAAFEGSMAEAPKLWGKWADACTSLARREAPVEQAGRWQRLNVKMLWPASADFLVFECAVVQRQPAVTEGAAEFPAHYLDDVRVRLLPPTREMHAAE